MLNYLVSEFNDLLLYEYKCNNEASLTKTISIHITRYAPNHAIINY